MEDNKSKIWGIPTALFVIGLIAVGGVMAALVDYLSNQATVTADIDSPLQILVSNDGNDFSASTSLGSGHGGSTVELWVREINHANNPIEDANIVINISEAGGPMVCGEITSMIYDNLQGWTYDLTTYCDVENGNAVYRPFPNQTIPVGHNETFKINITFAQNAVGNYTAAIQHMMPEGWNN